MREIPHSIFTTDTIDASKRYDSFQETMNVIFEVTDPTVSPFNFHAKIESYLLNEMLLVRCDTNGQKFRRTPLMIAKDQSDHFLVQTFLKGCTRPLSGRMDSCGESGKILIIDASQPWEASNSDFDNLTLVIPRRLLSEHLLHENDHHGRLIGPDNPLGQLFLNTMLTIYRSINSLTENDTESISKFTLNLIASALNRSSDKSKICNAEIALRSSLQSLKIKQFIEQNLVDKNLTPKMLADHFGLSKAHLYRIFNVEGGIMDYIRKRRMTLALRRLQNPSWSGSTISEIAISSGYNNEAAFSRAFKQHFNRTPREVRSRLQAPSIQTDSVDQSRQWESWFTNL